MTEFKFCHATAEDAQQILTLSRSLIDAYEDISTIDYNKVLCWMEKKISINIKTYTVVMAAGEKVGYYRLTEENGMWELDDFYILPQYRRKGIGSCVLEHICSKANGRIFLYVFTQNTGAIALYKRFGFRQVKTVSPTRQIMERPG